MKSKLLIAALAEHQPDRAEAAMRTHIERAFQRFSQFFTG